MQQELKIILFTSKRWIYNIGIGNLFSFSIYM